MRKRKHEAWKQQVADNLPPEKAEAAYEALQRETGLGRGELGLPPRLKDETGRRVRLRVANSGFV